MIKVALHLLNGDVIWWASDSFLSEELHGLGKSWGYWLLKATDN